jgi:hypothetical protein
MATGRSRAAASGWGVISAGTGSFSFGARLAEFSGKSTDRGGNEAVGWVEPFAKPIA